MAVDVYYYSYDCNHQEEEEEDDDEEYIDMEVNPLYKSNNNFPCPPSPPSKEDEGHHHQFEFQMSSTLTSSSLNQQSLSTTSPADELFYMGKLLPLHLPPRLHTIESILQNRASFRSTPSPPDDDAVSTPPSLVAGTPVASTPFLSCNASPVESCHVSGELNINGEEYLRDYREHEHQLMVEISGDEFESEEEEEESRRSWMRKLSMIKHVLLGSKLKGSRAYLRNLLSKSVCSHKSSASVVNNNEKRAGGGSKKKKKKNEAAVADSSRREIIETKQHDADESGSSSKICHRRSFSGVFKRRSASMAKISAATSTLSSFSSSSTLASCTGNNSIYNKELKRSNGTTTTNSNNIAMECPIQGAIAHCKRSHHQEEVKMVRSRKALSEVGLFGFQDRS